MFLNWFACVAFQLKRAIGFYGKVFPKHRILQLLHCNMYDYGLDAFISFIPCCYICAYLSEKETKCFQAFEVNQREKRAATARLRCMYETILPEREGKTLDNVEGILSEITGSKSRSILVGNFYPRNCTSECLKGVSF